MSNNKKLLRKYALAIADDYNILKKVYNSINWKQKSEMMETIKVELKKLKSENKELSEKLFDKK